MTSELGAITRTVFESARTLFVWLGDLALFYTLRNPKLGEAWDRSSYVQVRQTRGFGLYLGCKTRWWARPGTARPTCMWGRSAL